MHACPLCLTFEQRSASQGAALEEMRGPIILERPTTASPSSRLGRFDQHVNRVARFGAPVLVLGISVKQNQSEQKSEMLQVLFADRFSVPQLVRQPGSLWVCCNRSNLGQELHRARLTTV